MRRVSSRLSLSTASLIIWLILALPARAEASAHPSVTVGASRVVLRAAHARVLIARRPFHLTFQEGTGRRVLSESGAGTRRPLYEGAVQDPFSGGLTRTGARTLYAPLSFLVGSEELDQYQGGLWGGNLLSGSRFGVFYSARRVLHVQRVRGGVRLTVSTDDPSRRRLIVTVRIAASAARVSVVPHPARGVVEMGDSFVSSRGEGFFGFGGRHNAVDQHGRTFTSFVSEENLDQYQGHPSLYPGGPAAAYDPAAEFFSSRPYGFLLAQPQLARFKLDASGHRDWNVSAVARSLNYVVAPGGAATAIRTLTALSGRQPVPPRWGLGPMLDRLVKTFGESTADYERQVRADLANLRRYRMPITAYRLEGWAFPGTSDKLGLSLHSFVTAGFQRSVFANLRARGIHPLVYLRPWLAPNSVGVRRGYEARTARGTPYYTTSTSGVKIALLDFTNPAAVRYWQRLVAHALDTGAGGFMQDFGEEVLFGMHFHNGQTGVALHNEYPVLYDRATRQEFRRYARAHPGRGGFFFFTRAGYSGEPGSAAYESATFPGDETTDFSHASGLASLTSDMLGRAVDGSYGYGTDIGGYYDLTTPPTTKELFLRWAEWAALSPVFRLHGSGIHGTHTPWSFDAQTVSVYRSLSELHLRAAPLIMRLWRQADRTGIPVTRPLWLADPQDRQAWNQDQEWLLGTDLLVAPVVRAGASSRSVFFPSGCWRGDGKLVHGPRNASVSAPLAALPYFTRCGTHPLRRSS